MFYGTFASMNTRFSMVLPSEDAAHGERLACDVQRLLRDQETMMSRFASDAELFTINRHAQEGPVGVGEGLWDVLDACRRHHGLTDGAFDIAAGAGRPGHGMHQVEFDPDARTVRFAAPGLQLDLGGIGKGVALDAVRRYLRARDVGRAFLSFGESSVAVIGSHPADACWPVGVEHLFVPGTSLHRFALCDGALSTSGNRPGQAHIIDPVAGKPVTGCRTVSVACAGAADAEALSTALFVLPAARTATVLQRYRGAQAVAFDYHHDGNWTVEKGWQHDLQAR
jgi:thiamine biosynthesis lipoprotein